MNELTEQEFNQLATYNAEVSRGIEHKEYWKRYMAGLQDKFDQSLKKKFERDHKRSCLI